MVNAASYLKKYTTHLSNQAALSVIRQLKDHKQEFV